jgi:hypothetical protein
MSPTWEPNPTTPAEMLAPVGPLGEAGYPALAAPGVIAAAGAGERGRPRLTSRGKAGTRRAVLGGVGSGAILAACGGGGSQETPRAAVDKNQKDELTWLVWSSDAGTRKEAYDTMTKRFGEQFPNVMVQRIAGGNENLEKLITMLASDTRVDVLANLRTGKVAVNAGLADIDRRVAAVLSQK